MNVADSPVLLASPVSVGQVTPAADGMGSCHPEVRAAILAMGDMADWQVPVGTLAHFGSWLGWPGWMRKGTPFEQTDGPPPSYIRVRDDLTMVANLLDHVDLIELVQAVVRVGQPSATSLGKIAFSSGPTLADSIALTEVLLAFSSPYLQPSLREDGAIASIDLQANWPLGSLMNLAGLCWMAYHRMAIAGIQPLAMAQVQITSTLPVGVAADRLQALFGCELEFGAAANSIRFPADWLTIPNPGHDPMIWAIACERSRNALAKLGASDQQARIRQRIVLMMDRDGSPPRLKQVAIAENMSPRSIVRALGEAGTSFHTLVEEERRLRAISLMANPALTIGQVAEMLGFPDTSSFGRKFRGWFGDSPARFRRAPSEAA